YLAYTFFPSRRSSDLQVTVGAGFSGSINMTGKTAATEGEEAAILGEAATAPGFAPWVGGRAALGNDFDGGLIYTARSIRADLRRSEEHTSELQSRENL